VSRRKRVAGNLALVLASVAAAFLIAEVTVRVTGLAKPSLYTWAPYRGWSLEPRASGWQRDEGEGFIRVNSAGFRGPEWTVVKPPGTFRIAVVGDSFTEAPQVAYEDTFCAVAEKQLGRCGALAGKKVQVMDFGTDAYGTAQELITLNQDAWRYSPDMVVLAFFSGNDLRNNSVVLEGDKCRPFYVYDGDKLVLGGPFERSRWFHFSCMMRFESRHSQVLNLLGDAKSQIRSKIKSIERQPPRGAAQRNSSRMQAARFELVSEEEAPIARETHGRSQPSLGHEEGIEDNIYHPPTTDAMKDAWRVTEGIITMMARDAAAHHVPLLVVTLANPPQIYPNPRVRASYMQIYGSTDIFYPDERIKALGEREGIEVLNLAPLMQAYADQHHVYLTGFRNTKMGVGHWNAAGQRLGGKLIAQRICEMKSSSAPQKGAR
jgi:hypothetical protein